MQTGKDSHKAFRIIIIHQEGWRCSGGSLRAQLAELEWILPRLLRNWISWQSEDSGTWASVPETGWSGTGLLQPNRVVGCEDISIVFLWIFLFRT